MEENQQIDSSARPARSSSNEDAAVAQEAVVRLDELAVRRLEAQKKLAELRARWWHRGDPLTLAILAAALGLAGNLGTAIYNNGATVRQEKAKAQSEEALESKKAKYNLILQSIAQQPQNEVAPFGD